MYGTATVGFIVSFEVEKMGYASAQDGFTQMTNSYNILQRNGVFIDQLHSTSSPYLKEVYVFGGGGQSFFTGPTVTVIELKFPSFAPTVSPAPSARPTGRPTPTYSPSTILPTLAPNSRAPTVLPTFRTSKLFIDLFHCD
jgi:hypothetical protein